MFVWKKALLVAVGMATLAGCGGAASTPSQQELPQAATGNAVAEVVTPTTMAGVAGLPARLAEDGVTIEVGRPEASNSVTVYEDYRCPYCSKFERANAAVLAERAAAGQLKIRYVFASFLDGKFGGSSSVRAANAARAALDAGAFPAYHALLQANQPPKGSDGFTVERLLQLADTIPALRDSREFVSAVRNNVHASWVAAAQAAYTEGQKDFPNGVPTVVINKVDANDVLYDAGNFTALLDASLNS